MSLLPNGPPPAGRREPFNFVVSASPDATQDLSEPVQVVVTMNEINNRHGTGPLVKRLYQGRRNVLAIRSRNDWGVQDFGDWHVCLPQQRRTRSEAFLNVLRILRGRNVETVLCVPFLVDELITSIAIKDCFGARLCVYIMDDQNIASSNIPDALMRELLEKCSFRLATHPELRTVYEDKYGLPFYLLPAIVPAHLVSQESAMPTLAGRRGALLGSFWDQWWFDRLCAVLEGCGWAIDWFGNPQSPWLKFPPKTLARAGITARGLIPEEQLAIELRKYPFVLVPVGALDGQETNTGVSSLSLPGRILFALATSHTPLLVVGSNRTCGARFVSQFGIGEVVPYDAESVSAAMDRLSEPANQAAIRRKAASLAPSFSDQGVAEWLARSIELERPAGRRFEDAFAGYDGALHSGLRAQAASAVGTESSENVKHF